MLLYYSQTVSAIATATCDLRAAALLLFEAITRVPNLFSKLSHHWLQVVNNHYSEWGDQQLVEDLFTFVLHKGHHKTPMETTC